MHPAPLARDVGQKKKVGRTYYLGEIVSDETSFSRADSPKPGPFFFLIPSRDAIAISANRRLLTTGALSLSAVSSTFFFGCLA